LEHYQDNKSIHGSLNLQHKYYRYLLIHPKSDLLQYMYYQCQ